MTKQEVLNDIDNQIVECTKELDCANSTSLQTDYLKRMLKSLIGLRKLIEDKEFK